jgi:hypothetical protein
LAQLLRQGRVVCSLRCVELSDEPAYEAVSYCWGTQTPSKRISCDGLAFKLTKNLFNAFCSFRDANVTVTLWADAICINQAEKDEKSRQVPLMWRIYSQAHKAKVWFGLDEEGHAAEATDTLNVFASATTALADDLGFSTLDNLFASTTRQEWNERLVGVADRLPIDMKELFSQRRMQSFAHFLSHPWFRRAWIVQDIALARHGAVIHWGTAATSWSTVRDAISVYHYSADKKFLTRPPMSGWRYAATVSNLFTTIFSVHSETERPLLHILASHQSTSATTPETRYLPLRT